MSNSTLYRQELKSRILIAAMQEFKVKGIKSVKMDDIANLLGISKRTLYETYANKEELLYEGVLREEASNDAYLRQFAAKPKHHVMDILAEFYRLQIKNLANINPLFFSDLHKYPRIISFLSEKHKVKELKSHEFFQKGVEEGYFLEGVDYRIIFRLANAAMQHAMQTQMYKEFDMDRLLRNTIILFIRGICTQKGIAMIDNFEWE
jgi:AcrR family transcriptional regulator